MEIPRYWAEHREQRKLPERKQVTLRRFGWSSVSQAQAQLHAEQRVSEAWSTWGAVRKQTRREAKVAYAGADGLPIREEIIAEYPEVEGVVTRNSYGARCLNVPDVLFADIDLGEPQAHLRNLKSIIIGFIIIVGALALFLIVIPGSIKPTPIVVISAISALFIWRIFVNLGRWLRSSNPNSALAPVHKWCDRNSTWLIHAYRTPAGFRLLATHASINPKGDEATSFFASVKTDPLYQLMCQKQACFRARVSPKPWRIKMPSRIGWGSWPLTSEKATQRRLSWVNDYETKAKDYAACAYVVSIGNGVDTPRGRRVREIHDALCQVGRGLPIA